MTFKDRVRRTISSRNTTTTTTTSATAATSAPSPTSSSPSSSPTTTQPSSRNASSTDLSQTTTLTASPTTTNTVAPSPLEHSSTLRSTTTTSSTKTSSSLKSLSKKFTLRREKKEVFGKNYDPQSAAVLGAWQWGNSESSATNGNGRLGVNSGRNSVWSAISPNTSRRGSAISGYAVAREIERVDTEMESVGRRLQGLAVA